MMINNEQKRYGVIIPIPLAKIGDALILTLRMDIKHFNSFECNQYVKCKDSSIALEMNIRLLVYFKKLVFVTQAIAKLGHG